MGSDAELCRVGTWRGFARCGTGGRTGFVTKSSRDYHSCNRVLSAKNRIGGLSAFGGANSKRTLLELEGVAVRSQRRVDLPDLSSIDIRKVVLRLFGDAFHSGAYHHRVGDFAFGEEEPDNALFAAGGKRMCAAAGARADSR